MFLIYFKIIEIIFNTFKIISKPPNDATFMYTYQLIQYMSIFPYAVKHYFF